MNDIQKLRALLVTKRDEAQREAEDLNEQVDDARYRERRYESAVRVIDEVMGGTSLAAAAAAAVGGVEDAAARMAEAGREIGESARAVLEKGA